MTKQNVPFFYLKLLSLLLSFSACNIVSVYHRSLDRKFTRKLDTTVTLDINRTQLFCQYTISDSTKPYLLVLHGFGVDGRLTFFQHLKYFSKKYNMIIPDLPGFGKSYTYNDNYSAYNSAHTIKLLLDTLKIPTHRLYVCGQSYGGLIAALINKELQGNLAGISLNGSPLKYFNTDFFDKYNNEFKIENGTELILPQNKKALSKLLRAGSMYYMLTPWFMKRQVLADVFLPKREQKLKVIRAIVSEEKKLRADDYGFHLQKNIMIVVGAKDRLIPKLVSDSLVSTIAKHAHYKIFKRQSHNLMAEAKFGWRKYVNTTIKKWEQERMLNGVTN
jgi:pimeloyl-ACP methyl ester carboxylesterase